MPSKPRSLPDRLAPGLDVVSIGINPSVYTAIHGFNFARPGNRFWPTFNAAGLVPEPLVPGRSAVMKLLREYKIGFTDLVKRATDRADELSDADYRKGAAILKRKLERYRPKIAWFQGTSAYQKYLEFAEGVKRKIAPGLQPERIGDTVVFVTPNPSGANPAANPKLLLPWYRELARLRDRLSA
ncbi:MAG TPA: mismatch-specific DNA-glycosylase [Burkholderiales bacterium]|nr:mismatch-specific DNA-glycosylase [Burkholderiales bacterium]